jgi:hypothetical protein
MHEEPDEPSPLRVALNRYRAQFGEFPALFVVWRGPDEDLIEVIDWAILTNKVLDEDEMIRAQGGEPPTGDVLF